MRRIALLAVAAVLLFAWPALAFDANDLAKFLPDKLGGLKAMSPARTLSMSIKNKKVFHAARKYADGDQRVTVMIRAGGYTAQMAATIKMKLALDNDRMSLKPITVKGFPGQLVIHKTRKQVSVRVLAMDKLVMTSARKTVDPKTSLKMLDDMDLKGLAALK
jgi:hypothetical protein